MTTDIINPYSVETLFHSDTMFEMLKTHYMQKKHRRDAYINKHLAQVVQKKKDKAWTDFCNENLLLYGRCNELKRQIFDEREKIRFHTQLEKDLLLDGRYNELKRQILDEREKIRFHTKREKDLLILRDEAQRKWEAHGRVLK